MSDYDLLGNIAIIKSEIKGRLKTKNEKEEEARELLRKPGIKGVFEKSTNVHGRLRTIKPKHVLGEKSLIAEYKENNCIFNFNIGTCYFSPRLANERQLISEKIGMNDKLLVMFAGVGVYPIILYKYKRPIKIVGIELGRDCCKYFKENLKLNKIPVDKIDVIQGDVKKKINKEFIKTYGKFDVVIMARPNLKETFLKAGLLCCRKNTRLFYYGFCKDDEIKQLMYDLENEAKSVKRKIRIKSYKEAGEIAPYKHRYRIEIDVLN